MVFVLTAATAQALEDHARACLPREACGLLVSRDPAGRTLIGYLPMANNAGSADRFAVDPVEFARAEKRLREEGTRLAGFFHSHPAGAAQPSAADSLAAWPALVHVILGLAGSRPELAAFIRDGNHLRRARLEVAP